MYLIFLSSILCWHFSTISKTLKKTWYVVYWKNWKLLHFFIWMYVKLISICFLSDKKRIKRNLIFWKIEINGYSPCGAKKGRIKRKQKELFFEKKVHLYCFISIEENYGPRNCCFYFLKNSSLDCTKWKLLKARNYAGYYLIGNIDDTIY